MNCNSESAHSYSKKSFYVECSRIRMVAACKYYKGSIVRQEMNEVVIRKINYIREKLGIISIEKYRKKKSAQTKTALSTYFLFLHQSYLPLDKNRTYTISLEQIINFLLNNCLFM